MKTQLIAFMALFAPGIADASINTSEAMPLAIASQPATYQEEPFAAPDATCREARQMIFILRDPSGAIVAMGVARVPESC